MSWHLRAQTPLIIFENVKAFDPSLLSRWMSGSYDIFIQRMGPEDVGWPCCRRPRVYVALVNRGKIALTAHPNDMFARVSAALQQHELRVRDLLVAPATEIARELIQLATMRKARLASSGDGFVNMAAVLSEQERERMEAYGWLWESRFRSPMGVEQDLLLNLGDSPMAGFVNWSAPADSCGDSRHRVPTLRKDWKVMWVPSRKRWMTVNERAVAMGFPVYDDLRLQYGLSSPFSIEWRHRGLPGNSMHVACVGVWQACVAACCRLKD